MSKFEGSEKYCIALTKTSGYKERCPFGSSKAGKKYVCNAHLKAVKRNPDHPLIDPYPKYREKLLEILGVDRKAASKPDQQKAEATSPSRAQAEQPWLLKYIKQIIGGVLLGLMALISEHTYLQNFGIDLNLFIFDVKSISMFARNMGYLIFFAIFFVFLPITLVFLLIVFSRVIVVSINSAFKILTYLVSKEFRKFLTKRALDVCNVIDPIFLGAGQIIERVSFMERAVSVLSNLGRSLKEYIAKKYHKFPSDVPESYKIKDLVLALGQKTSGEYVRTVDLLKSAWNQPYSQFAITAVLLIGLVMGVSLRHHDGALIAHCAKNKTQNTQEEFEAFCRKPLGEHDGQNDGEQSSAHLGLERPAKLLRVSKSPANDQTSVAEAAAGEASEQTVTVAILSWFARPFKFLWEQATTWDDDLRNESGREFARWAHSSFIWSHLVRQGNDVTVVMKNGKAPRAAIVSYQHQENCPKLPVISDKAQPAECAVYVHNLTAPMLHLGEFGRWNFFYTFGEHGRALMIDQGDIAMISDAPIKFKQVTKQSPPPKDSFTVYHDVKDREALEQAVTKLLKNMGTELKGKVDVGMPEEVRRTIASIGDALVEPGPKTAKTAKAETEKTATPTPSITDATVAPPPKGSLIRRLDDMNGAIAQISQVAPALEKLADQHPLNRVAYVAALMAIAEGLPKPLDANLLNGLVDKIAKAIKEPNSGHLTIGTRKGEKFPIDLNGDQLSVLKNIAKNVADLNGKGTNSSRVADQQAVQKLGEKLSRKIEKLDTHPASGADGRSVNSAALETLDKKITEIHTWPHGAQSSELLKAIKGIRGGPGGDVDLPAHLLGIIGRIPEECKARPVLRVRPVLQFANNRHKNAPMLGAWAKAVTEKLGKSQVELEQADGALVILEGTADSRGAPQYNHWISERRATTAYYALKSRLEQMKTSAHIKKLHLASFGTGEWERYSRGGQRNGDFVSRSVLVRVCYFNAKGDPITPQELSEKSSKTTG